MTGSVPLSQVMDQAREIAALRAEVDGLKHTLAAWVAECGEGGPRPIKDDVKALAEALVNIEGELLYAPVWLCIDCLDGTNCMAAPTCTQREAAHAKALRLVRAALARLGVVHVREEAQ